MALVQTVHLSMANFKSAPVVPAVQNDTDRQVKMIIDDYTLTSGLTGKIAFERSDGTHYETAAELVLAYNAFTADIDQALTQPGRTMVQLKVTDTLTVSSFSFVIFVEADNSGTVTPQEGIDLVTAVAAAEAAADRAESAAETLELDATLTSATKAAQSAAVGDAIDGINDALHDPEQLMDAKLLNNLFNKNRVFYNYVINSTTGLPSAYSGRSISDFIEVIEGNVYNSFNVTRHAFYDSNKDCLTSTISGTNLNKTVVPTGAKYLRVEFNTSNIDNVKLYQSIFKQESNDVKFEVFYPWLKIPKVDARDIQDAQFLNLFDKSKSLDGYYVNNTNGSRETSSSYFVSEFIAVKPETKYTISNGGRYACYDSNKQYISGDYLSGGERQLTTPSGAAYIIICGTPLTIKDTLVFAETAYYEQDNYKPYSIRIPWLETALNVNPYNIEGAIFTNIFNKVTAVDGYYVESTTGTYNNANQNYWRSGFIPVYPDTLYRQSANNRVAFYDKEKVYITGYNSQYTFTSPSNAAYIMVCNSPLDSKNTYILAESANYPDEYSKYGVMIPWLVENNPKSKYDDKKLICFGDSITNLGYTDTIKMDTGIEAINVGLSSGRYAYSDDSNQYVNAFAFHNICYSISSGDWTIPDSINGVSGYETQYAHIQAIKAIDFSTVDFVSIAYGTNDFSSATPLDNENNPLDTNTFKGAIRYCLKLLTGKYPHIKIIGVTPCYRFWVENGEVLYDSDDHAVGGMYISQFVEAIEDVYTEFHLPFVNNYDNAGINKYNRLQYFNITDGLHPNSNGRAIIGHRIGAGILANY